MAAACHQESEAEATLLAQELGNEKLRMQVEHFVARMRVTQQQVREDELQKEVADMQKQSELKTQQQNETIQALQVPQTAFLCLSNAWENQADCAIALQILDGCFTAVHMGVCSICMLHTSRCTEDLVD